MGDRALVPPKVFKSISVYAICGSAFFTRCALLSQPLHYFSMRLV
jgi:hypothetical protein